MRSADVRAIGELAGRTLAGGGAMVRDLHMAVAERAFTAVGPGGAPARAIHDGVAEALYGGARMALGALPRGAGSAFARSTPQEAPALAQSPRGSLALAALNAYIGDALVASGSELALTMTLRHRGADLPLEPDALACALPDAGPRVAIFVHGLGETDASWRLRADAQRPGYGAWLQRDLGHTPIELRYNTGLHISDNGRALAALLDEPHDAWPSALQEIVIVGHSMGGLVARSACHQSSRDGHGWTGRVRHVVSLGTPHMGAPLEQAVHVASYAFGKLPETRMFSAFLRRRSSGIRDLRRGSLVDEDWRARDPEALRAAACEEVPLLDGATHCFVSATVTRSPRHPVGRVVGDTLVLQPSASGRSRTRKLGFQDEFGLHIGATNHIALLNHPAVYEKLREWLR